MVRGGREEAADGDEKCQKPATSMTPSGSDLHNLSGEGFDRFSLYLADSYLGKATIDKLSSVFALISTLLLLLLCVNSFVLC